MEKRRNKNQKPGTQIIDQESYSHRMSNRPINEEAIDVVFNNKWLPL